MPLPTTQEELDQLISGELAQQKAEIEARFAGFDDLKAKAEQFDQAQEAGKTELQKLRDRAEKAEQDRDRLAAAEQERTAKAEQAKQVAGWAAEVAKAEGVPAELLRGATKDELQAHAKALKPVIAPQRHSDPNAGRTPTNEPDNSAREAIRKLFGRD